MTFKCFSRISQKFIACELYFGLQETYYLLSNPYDIPVDQWNMLNSCKDLYFKKPRENQYLIMFFTQGMYSFASSRTGL